MSIFDIDHWKSKAGILSSANSVQIIESVESLLALSRSAENSAQGFRNLGPTYEREAKICQLKAEMFAARAKELSNV
jgi:hypothetical protein